MNFRLILFLFTFCNVRGQILKGRKAEPNQFPYVVQVHTEKPYLSSERPDFERKVFRHPHVPCNGVIISEKFVLTAAHCVRVWNRVKDAWIVGGHLHLDYEGTFNPVIRKATHIKRHTNFYGKFKSVADIAVLYFANHLPLNRNNNGLGSIKIGPKSDEPAVGTQCKVMGWGLTVRRFVDNDQDSRNTETEHSVQTHYLMWGRMEVANNNDGCVGDEKTHICVKKKNVNHVHLLEGDSGSPLVCANSRGEDAVFGIHDAGTTYGTRTGATYTRLSHHQPWIDWAKNQAIKEHLKEQKEERERKNRIFRNWRIW